MAGGEEVAVIIPALSAEAEKWRKLAGKLETAKSAVDGLGLTIGAFFAGTDLVSQLLLAPTYNELQDRISTYLAQGSHEFFQVAAALDRARVLYEKGDIDAAKRNTQAIYGS